MKFQFEELKYSTISFNIHKNQNDIPINKFSK